MLKALSTVEKQGRAGGASRRGGLREAPLARALAAEDKGGGVALLADAQVARRPRLQVARGAAEEAPHQVVEEVPRVQHVDPRVAAAVEAGQEHGDDEGRGCKAERAIRVLWGRESPREGTGHSIAVPAPHRDTRPCCRNTTATALVKTRWDI